jgi:hypothetical protein
VIFLGPSEVITGEGAKDGAPEVAVDAALAPVVAGSDRQYSLVAGIAVVIHAFVAVAGREEHHAAQAVPAMRDGIVDRQTRAVGQFDLRAM